MTEPIRDNPISEFEQRLIDDRVGGREGAKYYIAQIGHLDGVHDAYAREKLMSLRSWADIYFSERRNQGHGGRQNVLHFMLSDLNALKLALGNQEVNVPCQHFEQLSPDGGGVGCSSLAVERIRGRPLCDRHARQAEGRS